MALGLDTKLMKVADEFADFDVLKPKDQAGPIFCTRETDSEFILTFQVKGYRRTDIKVKRSEDWSRIKVRGEKPVQDMLMVGGEVVKKYIEIRGFEKSFKVPPGLLSDKVRASFNEHGSELIIRMPKARIGLTGFGIEELKTKENRTECTKPLHIYTSGELSEQENQETEAHDIEEAKQDKENSKQEQVGTNDNDSKNDDSQEPKSPQRRFKICTPLILGSAFFMSLIVLVFHLAQQSEKPIKQQKKEHED